MVQTARFIVLAVALYLGYTAYRQSNYFVARSTGDSLDAIVRMADGYNANLSREDILEKATSNGELDVAKLRTLLTPAARRAGELVKLDRELKELAGIAKPEPPAPAKPEPAPPVRPTRAAPPSSYSSAGYARPFEQSLSATETAWQMLDAPPPKGNFTVVASGRVQTAAASTDEDAPRVPTYLPGLKLLVPGEERFAPLARLCAGDSCQPIQVGKRRRGVEWGIDFCAFESAPFDRIEVWYNDYYRDAKTDERLDLTTTYGANAGSYHVTFARYSDGECNIRSQHQSLREAGYGALILGGNR